METVHEVEREPEQSQLMSQYLQLQQRVNDKQVRPPIATLKTRSDRHSNRKN